MTLSDRVLREGPKRTRPVGRGAWTDPESGITIRHSEEMPQGVQALYRDGILLGVFNIGEPVPDLAVTDITLNEIDYELVKKSSMERNTRERTREYGSGRFKLPHNTDTVVRKRVTER